MFFPPWLRSRKNRSERTSAARTRGTGRCWRTLVLPRLENLEDRTVPSTFLVTNTLDSGPGSLRQAILNANASPPGGGADTIAFNIPTIDPGYQSSSGGWFRIAPLSGLPGLGDPNPLLLDGYSQPGARPNDLLGVGQLGVTPGPASQYGDDAILKIVLDGIQAGNAYGLVMGTSTVQGLVIDRFASGGIRTGQAGIIQGNFIGLDVTGTTAFDSAAQHLGNGYAGILLAGNANVTIGGTTPAARNVISGTWSASGDTGIAADGIIVTGGSGVTGNVVEGNFIGTDHTGTTTFDSNGRSLGNARNGVALYSGPNGNTIGGTATGAGNVISGNVFGISIVATSGNFVQGNFIGTDVTGSKIADAAGRPLGNNEGFFTTQAGITTIGGTTAGAGNLISGNSTGIDMRGPGNLVQGNSIGTDVSSTFALGNDLGILFQDNGSNNTIGGTTAGAGNVISGNRAGIFNNGDSGNVIQGNRFGTDKNGAAGNLPGWLADQHGPAPLHPSFGLGNQTALYVGGSNNIIGGPAAGAGNVIAYSSGGDAFGIQVEGTSNTISSNAIFSNGNKGIYSGGGTGNFILSNTIYGNLDGIGFGANVSGTLVQGNSITGNAEDGIRLATIGGSDTFSQNIIYSNAHDGISDYGGYGNTITQNSIYSNAHMGITFYFYPADNHIQSFPVLTSVSGSASGTIITGTLHSVAATSFRLEFFSNTSPDPSGYGQGRTFLGAITVTSDASGNASFTASLGMQVPAGQGYITATATNLTTGDTSGFALDLFGPIANAGGPYTIHEGDALSLDASATGNPGGGSLTYSWDINGAGTFSAATGVRPTLSWAQLNGLGVRDEGAFAVAVRATDSFGSSSVASGSLTVLNTPPTVGTITAPLAPVQVNALISAGASFTDPGILDTHTAVWNWGDNITSPGTVTETSGSGSVTGSHSYTTDGVFTVTLTVTDDDGASSQSVFRYMVVFNPSAGFVSGGGSITSAAGAYAANPALTGPANFGFNARYQSGATIPTGQTEFQFPAANLNFHSTSYDWLVITGAQAQYHGSGTINGAGNFGFLVTAIDGTVSGGPDKFRIKIWDQSSGTVVYDTQPGAAETAPPTTVLSGGHIAVHTGGTGPTGPGGGGGGGESSEPFAALLLSPGVTPAGPASPSTLAAPTASALCKEPARRIDPARTLLQANDTMPPRQGAQVVRAIDLVFTDLATDQLADPLTPALLAGSQPGTFVR